MGGKQIRSRPSVGVPAYRLGVAARLAGDFDGGAVEPRDVLARFLSFPAGAWAAGALPLRVGVGFGVGVALDCCF